MVVEAHVRHEKPDDLCAMFADKYRWRGAVEVASHDLIRPSYTKFIVWASLLATVTAHNDDFRDVALQGQADKHQAIHALTSNSPKRRSGASHANARRGVHSG